MDARTQAEAAARALGEQIGCDAQAGLVVTPDGEETWGVIYHRAMYWAPPSVIRESLEGHFFPPTVDSVVADAAGTVYRETRDGEDVWVVDYDLSDEDEGEDADRWTDERSVADGLREAGLGRVGVGLVLDEGGVHREHILFDAEDASGELRTYILDIEDGMDLAEVWGELDDPLGTAIRRAWGRAEPGQWPGYYTLA